MQATKVYDFSSGKEMVEVKESNRKIYHVMKDGTMTSYVHPQKSSRFKSKIRQAMIYFFELEDDFENKKQ